jgi:hypothetical protein
MIIPLQNKTGKPGGFFQSFFCVAHVAHNAHHNFEEYRYDIVDVQQRRGDAPAPAMNARGTFNLGTAGMGAWGHADE